MKDPVRLLHGDGSEAERALLRAGVSEEPPVDGPQRLAAALGVSLAPLSAPPPAPASTTGAEAAAGANATASTTASGTSGAGLAAAGTNVASKLALKWLALAATGAVIAAAALAIRGTGAPAKPGPGHGAGRTENARPPAEEPAAVDRGAASVTDATGPDRTGRPDAARAGSKSIAREIEQLDTARGRLQRGQARAALAELDAYRRAHPRGVLAQEAALLRIEALSAAGDRDAARRHAERFLREHPNSPHEARIRALLRGKSDAR
jgi:hypothetical protein